DLGADKADRTGLTLSNEENPALGLRGVRLSLARPKVADTLFAIASNTKAFTATSLNLLDEDGKLKMDDKVIDHLPSFRMSDPLMTLHWLPADRPARLGLAVSRKVDPNAVGRNRIKRV
ncbi:ribonuclease P protein component, partial [Stenotrophomonas sp. 3diitr2024]|uniref:ribonuclease P protein component n=1 Tax=Stenotrophomonas sp. 3diitr2024 TaxID=3345115 RepID=UPI0035CC7CEE